MNRAEMGDEAQQKGAVMGEIQRYVLTTGVNPISGAIETYRHAFANGEFVLHSDHLAKVEQLEKEIRRLNRIIASDDFERGKREFVKQERDSLKAENERLAVDSERLTLLRQDHLAVMRELRDYLDPDDGIEHGVKRLKAQLSALQWRRITPENLPKVGDEVICGRERRDVTQGDVNQSKESGASRWTFHGWTHFRPINPPKEEQHD